MTIRSARHALVLLALTAASPALAQDWRVAAITGAKPDRTVYLLDASAIVRTGDTVDFFTQSIFEEITETRDFDRSLTRRRGSCTTKSSQILENSYFANGALQDIDGTPGRMIAHGEKTIMYDVLEQSCGRKALQAASIADPETSVRAYYAK